MKPLFQLNPDHVKQGVNDGCLFKCIWAIGGPGSGKTTLAATIAPVRPGTQSVTLFLDLEGSSDTISTLVALDVVPVRQMAQEKQTVSKNKNLAYHLFDVTYEYLMALPNDHGYRVLVIDTASDLKIGANAWTRQHPELFGKGEQNYRGEQGSIYSWGDTKTFWKQFITLLKLKFEVVVLTSHESPVYSGGKKTNKLEPASADYTEVADLVLWLAHDKAKNRRTAVVVKSRASWPEWSEDADRPLVYSVLPPLLEPTDGVTYPELIQRYLDDPVERHNAVDAKDLTPWERELTDDERLIIQAGIEESKVAQQQLKLAENEEAALRAGKNKLVMQVREKFPTFEAAAIRGILSDNGLEYSLDQHDHILQVILTKLGQ